jgi:peptide subunit release factor 1 (eRF1)
MLARQLLKEAAEFDSRGAPVVSFYIDVDGKQYSPTQIAERTHQLVRQARLEALRDLCCAEDVQSFEKDLDHITRFIGAEFERGNRRGLVIFACSAGSLWVTIPLGVTVVDKIVTAPRPYLRPLAELADEFGRCGVVLLDREKARFFVFDMGDLTELNGLTDDVDGRVKPSSYYGMSDKNIERHVDNQIHQHLKHVSDEAARSLIDNEKLERILIAGTPDVIPEFKRILPKPLMERLVGEIQHLMIIASHKEVLAQSLEGIAAAKRVEEATLTGRATDAISVNGRAVTGLDATLHALHGRALNTLLLDRAFAAPGRVCSACGRLYVTGKECPECHNLPSRPVDDIVECAVEEAFRQDAAVKFVTGNPEWTAAGGIGALLRFSVPRPEAVGTINSPQ